MTRQRRQANKDESRQAGTDVRRGRRRGGPGREEEEGQRGTGKETGRGEGGERRRTRMAPEPQKKGKGNKDGRCQNNQGFDKTQQHSGGQNDPRFVSNSLFIYSLALGPKRVCVLRLDFGSQIHQIRYSHDLSAWSPKGEGGGGSGAGPSASRSITLDTQMIYRPGCEGGGGGSGGTLQQPDPSHWTSQTIYQLGCKGETSSPLPRRPT